MNPQHPLIQNANEYMFEKKYVSITSVDINPLKNPNPSNFEIELPQDYCNVQSVTLSSFQFPNNINNFSKALSNTSMTFTINNPYRPSDTGSYLYVIYLALYNKYISANKEFICTIDDGIYSSLQMECELTNRFNEAVSKYIIQYLTALGDQPTLDLFLLNGQYSEFIFHFNDVSEKLWFGNKSSGFVITRNEDVMFGISTCSTTTGYIEPITVRGLPYALGLKHPVDVPSKGTSNLDIARFYYMPGTSGIWLTPTYADSPTVYYIQPENKLNPLIGKVSFYIEIDKLNSMDETKPFTESVFTTTTNQTNGVVNSSFAKIPVYTNPNIPENNYYYNGYSFDNVVRVFNPPMIRIRRLKIKFRYHYGQIVDFGGLPFYFTLCFNLFLPQNKKNVSMYTPESL